MQNLKEAKLLACLQKSPDIFCSVSSEVDYRNDFAERKFSVPRSAFRRQHVRIRHLLQVASAQLSSLLVANPQFRELYKLRVSEVTMPGKHIIS